MEGWRDRPRETDSASKLEQMRIVRIHTNHRPTQPSLSRPLADRSYRMCPKPPNCSTRNLYKNAIYRFIYILLQL